MRCPLRLTQTFYPRYASWPITGVAKLNQITKTAVVKSLILANMLIADATKRISKINKTNNGNLK